MVAHPDLHETPSPPGRTASRRLRIGIDGTCLGSGRGYGRFLRELLPPLVEIAAPDQLVLFVDEATARHVSLPDLPLVRLRTRESQARAASAEGHRSLSDLWSMGRGVAAERPDVFYFPSLYSYFPVPGGIPLAVAIHDTIPERHGAVVFPSRRTRLLWGAKSRLARLQARTILTVSEYSRRRLHETLGIPLERIAVTPEAPSPAFGPVDDPAPRRRWLAARGWPEQAPYLLYVGGFNPHKNVLGLVRAFAQAARGPGGSELRLLLVGDVEGDVFHGNAAAIRAEIAARGLEPRVLWAGFVPDAELRHLYAGALALVLPSFEEGFGLPAVEAAACGAPCIATCESPLPEVLAGGGIFLDPRRPAALADAIARVVAEPALRAELAETARKRAAALSWRITAERTLESLLRTAERGGA
jgi:glycosyltransferase involved in cell wall biosynthesis